MKQLHFDR